MVRLVRAVRLGDLPLNEPLKYSLFDQERRLLLRSGYVITVPGFGEKLLERGCFIGDASEHELRQLEPRPDLMRAGQERELPGAPEPQAPVFQRCGELIVKLRRLQRLMVEVSETLPDIDARLSACAQTLSDLLQQDRDAVLAACLLLPEAGESRAAHQLFGAAVLALLAQALNPSPSEHLLLLKAALTRDLALIDFDRHFAALQALPANAQERRRRHAEQGRAYLQRHGISDANWLRWVLQHHERLDGSGYPQGLSGGQIDPLALLLGLSDAYAGMLMVNPRRSGWAPPLALRELAALRKHCFLDQHIALLVRMLGLYPPGTLVKLASGELAAVRNAAAPGRKPLVYSFYDRDGVTRSTPVARDSNLNEFAIVECVPAEQCLSAKLVLRRLWA